MGFAENHYRVGSKKTIMKKIIFITIVTVLLILSSCDKTVTRDCECTTVYNSATMPTPKPKAYRDTITGTTIFDGECSGNDAETTVTIYGDASIPLPDSTYTAKITCVEK